MASRPQDVAHALILLWLLMFEGTRCQATSPFKTELPINNIAVTKNHVFIAAGSKLYQLNTSLRTVVAEVAGSNALLKCPPGNLTPENKLLVVSQEEGLVYAGWNWEDGQIEKRNLSDIGIFVAKQTNVVSCLPGVASHGVVFNYKQDTHYLAIASIASPVPQLTNSAIRIYDDKLNVPEDGVLKFQGDGSLRFVDAFAWESFMLMPFTSNSIFGPRMLITSWKGHFTVCGEVLLQCSGAKAMRTLVSSAFIKKHGTDSVWAGIFTVDSPGHSPDNTALCIFSVKDMVAQVRSRKCVDNTYPYFQTNITVQMPILKSPTLMHSNLSSVHGIVVRQHIVIFMGTGNGQLLKVTLDKNLTAGCPEILYEIKEETPVFSRLALDPLDKRYIYIPTTYSVKRVKVANCDQYKSCSQCVLEADPYCGWCHSDARCTFEEDCVNGSTSQFWVSILEAVDQCLQIKFRPNLSNKILNFTQLPENKSCRVKNTTNKEIICESSSRCSRSWSCQPLSERHFNDITVEIDLSNRTVSERFEFSSCSQIHGSCLRCVRQRCTWCKSGLSCKSPYASCSLQDTTVDQSACPISDTNHEPAPNGVLPAAAIGSQITCRQCGQNGCIGTGLCVGPCIGLVLFLCWLSKTKPSARNAQTSFCLQERSSNPLTAGHLLLPAKCKII